MHIHRLQLYSKNLQAQREFYADRLRFPVKQESEKTLDVQIGKAELRFVYQAKAQAYHLAFHITGKKEEAALAWLKNRMEVLRFNEREIVDFSSWNAKSIYFYDADKNVLEFISRAHLFRSEAPGFSSKNICGIAEIGLAAQKIKPIYESLHQKTGLSKYSGDFEKFCPTGDDRGLLILIDNRKKKTWFPTDIKACSSPFRLWFSHRGKEWKLHFDGQSLVVEK